MGRLPCKVLGKSTPGRGNSKCKGPLRQKPASMCGWDVVKKARAWRELRLLSGLGFSHCWVLGA